MVRLLGRHFGTDRNGFTLVGNWYVLKQLGDNVDEYYYTLFVQALMREVNQRQQRSQAEIPEVDELLANHDQVLHQPNNAALQIEMINQ